MEQIDKRKQDKLKFDRVINLAHRLPQPAIHDLLRALILPIQADYLLAVGTEGQDARPDMNEREFFFTKIIWAMDYTHMKWHCCKVSDEAAFCLIQRPYISKTLLTRRISPRGSP
ncbi:hypothetical protein QS789_25530 [Escherichia coli]|nr:hypothetical protein [Escherichia coli]